MKNYFSHVIRNLTFEEVQVLGILSDNDANATFKSMKKAEVFKKTKLSLANFRKTLHKLIATHLVDVVTGGKEHKLFLTEYGCLALEKSLEEVESE